MINLSDCIELGVLGKPHGIKGQLILKLSGLDYEDIQEMESVFIIIDGLPVPFFIDEFSERSSDTLLIKFDTVHTESDARKYCDKTVFLEKKFISEHSNIQLSSDDLFGYKVIDIAYGELGVFESVLNIESNPVLSILKGKTEILIPLQDEFIVSINDTQKEIIVNCPAGLLELYI